MATVTKTKQEKPKKEKAEKAVKSFMEKLSDRVGRSLKQTTEINIRTQPLARMVPEDDQHFDAVETLAEAIDVAVTKIREASEVLGTLRTGGFAPASAVRSVKLSEGAQVWLRKSPWIKKYSGLFKPEELDGLAVLKINGRMVQARTPKGIVIADVAGAFTTAPTDYASALAE